MSDDFRNKGKGNMELVLQPEKSRLCGQCVVSMITKAPLDQVIAHMGNGITYPRAMQKACSHFHRPLMRKGTDNPPPSVAAAVILLDATGRCIHWIAWDGERYLDPRAGISTELVTEYRAVFYRVMFTGCESKTQ